MMMAVLIHTSVTAAESSMAWAVALSRDNRRRHNMDRDPARQESRRACSTLIRRVIGG